MSDPLTTKEQALLAEIMERHRPHAVRRRSMHFAWRLIANEIFQALKEAYLEGKQRGEP